jgi:Fe-S oxidoreductase
MERLDIVPGSERAAFHDPCYLCRYMGVENAPREIISAATGGETVEIRRSGKTAPCCGSGSWIDHGGHTRAAVNERLVEAHEAGADTLITACPKCAILFHEVNPACSWRQSPVAVRDLLVLLASRLKGNRKDRRGEGGGAG